MKKRLKAAAVAAMALVMLSSALPAIPCGTKLLNAPLTAHAAGSAVFDQDTRTLTLNGNVTKEQIWEYRLNDYVENIIAAKGCVLPADC
ncbi:MAG: hypothetical protein J5753_08795, partial [Oscillospiraceae bacterium]|nr:hypothetical protein [Oscillospiraceae bacterium]